MSVDDASPSADECAKLQRLLDRYRDLLVTAKDELLRRGITSQIESLEQKLRGCRTEDADSSSAEPGRGSPPPPSRRL